MTDTSYQWKLTFLQARKDRPLCLHFQLCNAYYHNISTTTEWFNKFISEYNGAESHTDNLVFVYRSQVNLYVYEYINNVCESFF